MRILICLLCFFIYTNLCAANYYVTTNGNSNNNGLSETNSWNITHAFSQAQAGDVVYVKAGNYGNVKLTVFNSGTSSKRIKFIGYKNTIGDISARTWSTYTYTEYKLNGSTLPFDVMPLLTGVQINGEGQGTGIKVERDYIWIENFMIQYYDEGMRTRAPFSTFKNIVTNEIGDFNPKHSYNPECRKNPDCDWGQANELKNLSGEGIQVYGDNTTVLSSLMLNSGARGLYFVNCDYIYSQWNKIYSDQNVNPVDYYHLTFGCNYAIVKNIEIHRVGNLTHKGHGLANKDHNSNNLFEDILITNTRLENYVNSNNNTFRRIHIEGTGDALSGEIITEDGANYNEYYDCSINNAGGIVLRSHGDGDLGSNSGTIGNKFVNCIVTNVIAYHNSAIDFGWQQQNTKNTAIISDTQFIGCTFDNTRYLFRVDRGNQGTILKDCIIKNLSKGYRTERYSENSILSLEVNYINCTFTNNNFQRPKQ